jgi:hypothetical protein
MTLQPALSRMTKSSEILFKSTVFVCLLLVVVGYAFTHPLNDFIEYWTAGHLLQQHKNPYSIIEVFRFQHSLGWREPVPLIPLNPPWTLALFIPLGFLTSYTAAWLVWVSLLIAASALSSRMLMDLYFNDLKIPEISDGNFHRALFAFTFYPVLLSLKFAQTTPVVLLGVAGFLYFQHKRWETVAGLMLALTSLKPNLVYLLWLAVLLRSIQRRSSRNIGGAVIGITVLSVISIGSDHCAITEYYNLTRSLLPGLLRPGITGGIQTLFKLHNSIWLASIPLTAGISWFMIYWWSHLNCWSWARSTPILVSMSILTTPYGWLFDQAVLAVPIIAVAAGHARMRKSIPRNLVLLYTVLNIVLILLGMTSSPWSFVPAPVLVTLLLLGPNWIEAAVTEKRATFDNPRT